MSNSRILIRGPHVFQSGSSTTSTISQWERATKEWIQLYNKRSDAKVHPIWVTLSFLRSRLVILSLLPLSAHEYYNVIPQLFSGGDKNNLGDYQVAIKDNSPQITKSLNFLLPFFGFGFNYTWVRRYFRSSTGNGSRAAFVASHNLTDFLSGRSESIGFHPWIFGFQWWPWTFQLSPKVSNW